MAGAETDEAQSEIVIPAAPSPAPKPESSPADVVLKVLGAVGTGIGILGFVIFFGGAIIWVRAEKAELPATEAVAVVPRSVLITTGATFLLPAVLIAAGVVAVIFLVHLIFRLFEENGLRPKRKKAKELRQQSAKTARTAVTEQQYWKLAEAALQRRQSELATAHERHAPAAEIAELERAVNERRVEAEQRLEIAECSISSAAAAKASADNLTEESEEKLERSGRQWWIELVAAGLALAVAVPLINGSICHLPLALDDFWEVGALVLVAVAGTAITLLVYWETEKFIWFGIVAFLAVGVYLAAGTYFSTHRNAKMQPVAALRPGHDPVTGSYVASNSESLFVGSFREAGTPPRLIVIPRSQVTEFVIGPLLDGDVAHRRAITMALNECEKEVLAPEPASADAGETESEQAPQQSSGELETVQPPQYEPACTSKQTGALKRALKAA